VICRPGPQPDRGHHGICVPSAWKEAWRETEAAVRTEVWTRAHLDLVVERVVRLAGGDEARHARALLETVRAEAQRPDPGTRTR